MRTGLRILAAVGVTLGCLYFALRGADWGEIRIVLARTRLEWVVAMMVVSVGTIWIRALRWRVLLRSVAPPALRPFFSATAVGFMANMLLPLRAGEIIRPVLLGRQTRIPTSTALASVLLERLLDLLLLFFFLLGISFTLPVEATMRRASFVVAAIVAGILVLIVGLLRNQERALGAVRRIFRRLPGRAGDGVADVLEGFLGGVAAITDARTIVALFGYSFAVWAVIAVTFGCGLRALDVQVPMVAASVTLVVVVAAFVSLPQAPGFVGTWQAGCVAALGFFEISKEEAIGYSLVTHVAQVVVIVALGIACLVSDNVGLRELASLAQRTEPEKT